MWRRTGVRGRLMWKTNASAGEEALYDRASARTMLARHNHSNARTPKRRWIRPLVSD